VRVTVIADHLRLWPASGIATYSRGLLDGLRAMGGEAPEVTVQTSLLPPGMVWRLRNHNLGGWTVRDADVAHCTSLAAPLGARMPVVVTVHDVAWREVPAAFPRRHRRWHEEALQRAVRHAAAVVAPSHRTARLLADGGVPGDLITVIPMGCDHLPPPDHEGADKLLTALEVTTPFLLSVSVLEPRKNLPRVLDAYDRARARLPEPWPLLVVGPRGWGPSLAPGSGVKLTGEVTAGVLSALYDRARCLVYVPLVEGWGLPPVEAMAAGIPVVSSATPSTGGSSIEV
jgi:glycosyltransferase involved in cell wall biosynthesis